MQNEADNVRLGLVHVHVQGTLVPVQSKAVGTERHELPPGPRLGVGLQFVQNAFGQIGTIDEPRPVRSSDNVDGPFLPGGRYPVPYALPQCLHERFRGPGQPETEFGKVRREQCGVHNLQISLVAIARFGHFLDLLEALLHELAPSRRVGNVPLRRPRVVAFLVLGQPFLLVHGVGGGESDGGERHEQQGGQPCGSYGS